MKRQQRLSRSRDFEAVYRKGRSFATRYLVVYAFPREDAAVAAEARLGLAVSRKVGGAVARNRLKRRLRAAFEELAASVAAGHDYAISARPGLAEAAETHGFAWLKERVAEALELARGSERSERA